MRTRNASLFAAALLLPVLLGGDQGAARELQLIRDAEVENTIRTYATPLFQAAGLSPKDIDVYLVKDSSLNAFVAGGLNLFVHTGTLMRAKDPLAVIGVIAHETGHLAAGHQVTRGENVKQSVRGLLASYVIGLGAALATGRPEVARAVITGGQDIALKGILSYTRSQESAADDYAVRLLNGTGQSPSGLLDFMRMIGGQEALFSSRQDPYLRSHPLTQERISYLEEQVRRSPHAGQPASATIVAMHQRMQAKLIGFLETTEQVLRRYPETDVSLPARYARAITRYRNSDLETGLRLIDELLAENPDDPYFRELKGQMLFEYGRIAEAVPEYHAAAQLLPDSPQIALALAQAQIELNDPEMDKDALNQLAQTLRHEPSNAFAWRLTAIVYGRSGDIGMTALALAESALAKGQAADARDQAVRAKKILPEDSPGWLRAGDIEQLATRLAEEKEN